LLLSNGEACEGAMASFDTAPSDQELSTALKRPALDYLNIAEPGDGQCHYDLLFIPEECTTIAQRFQRWGP